MADIYRVAGKSVTKLEVQQHLSEKFHLQDLVAREPRLIPGEQIDPEDPRRWVVLAREVQIPEPDTGKVNWSLDLLLADQDATPTLVECKLDQNHESRREVLGQMIEYAANAQYYWPLEEYRSALMTQIEACAAEIGQSIDDRVQQISPDTSVDAFVQSFYAKLLTNDFRLILVVDRASRRLKSSVEFINRQLQNIDFFIVEMKHASDDTGMFVAPQVFGYNEEVRIRKAVASKQLRTAERGVDRRWDVDRFRAVFEESAPKPELADRVLAFREKLSDAGLSLDWGYGVKTGSFGFRRVDVSDHRLGSVETNGKLWLNVGYVSPAQQVPYRDLVERQFQHAAVRTAKYIAIPLVEWIDRQDAVIDILRAVPTEAEVGQLV